MNYRLPLDTVPVTLGMLELTSIAIGYFASDAMLKRAPVRLLDARPASLGKFIAIVTGDVASVEEAIGAGTEAAGTSLFGSFCIQNLSSAIIPVLNGELGPIDIASAVGIVETFGAASSVVGIDAALKTSDVTAECLWLLNGIGGKGFFVLSGEVDSVDAAVEGAVSAIDGNDLADVAVIPRVHGDLVQFLRKS